MKVVINTCYGGFSVSLEAVKHMAAAGSERAKRELAEHAAQLVAFKAYRDHGVDPGKDFLKGMWDIRIKYGKEPEFHGYGYVNGMDGGYERDDPLLVSSVEALGEKANGPVARLSVVEIPDGVEWTLGEYDGIEHVAEKHRTWS